MTPLLAIDPGSESGAFCTRTREGQVTCEKLPGPPAFLFAGIQQVTTVLGPGLQVYIEDVGKSRKGNARHSADTFSKHRGHLEMLMVALGLAKVTRFVSPLDWMKNIDPAMSWPHGNEGKVVTARKAFFFDRMRVAYPELKFPKYAADAVGILHYARSRHD